MLRRVLVLGGGNISGESSYKQSFASIPLSMHHPLYCTQCPSVTPVWLKTCSLVLEGTCFGSRRTPTKNGATRLSPKSSPNTCSVTTWLQALASAEGQSPCAMEKKILPYSYYFKCDWNLSSRWPDAMISNYGIYSGMFRVLNQQTVLAIEQTED